MIEVNEVGGTHESYSYTRWDGTARTCTRQTETDLDLSYRADAAELPAIIAETERLYRVTLTTDRLYPSGRRAMHFASPERWALITIYPDA